MSRSDPLQETVALPPGRFRSRPSVIGTQAQDSVVLLDRATGRYLTLNRVAGYIWEQLSAGADPEQIVDRLLDEYDAPRAQVAADVTGQVRDFLQQGLIEPLPAAATDYDQSPAVIQTSPSRISATSSHPSAAPRTLSLPSHIRCAAIITLVKLRLSLLGYERTLRWIRRQVESTPPVASVSLEAVRAVEYRVALVAALYPGRALCLEQSLTLYLLLRRRGVALRFCQGVQPHPFQAHAWVEYHDTVVNDVDEHVKLFTPLPGQLP